MTPSRDGSCAARGVTSTAYSRYSGVEARARRIRRPCTWAGTCESDCSSATCHKYEIAPTLYYRWKDEMQKGALLALGRSAAARPDKEQAKRIRQAERALGRSQLRILIRVGFVPLT
jgi:hypothetical protein